MKLAFLFAPQGTQKIGMGKDLYESSDIVSRRFDQAQSQLSYDLLDIMFNDEEKLHDTRYVQTALFTFQAAIIDLLSKNGVTSEGSLGLSLGEYPAFYDRGVFDFKTGIEIIEHRAFFMDQACQAQSSQMAAIKSEKAKVEALVSALDDVYLANHNSENQCVISGTKESIAKASEKAKAFGIKRLRLLNTSGAFHSPFMESARVSFAEYLSLVKLNAPNQYLYLNTTGQRYQKEDLKEVMADHITHQVRFHEALLNMVSDGFDTFVEIGPKATLSAFVKKILPGATTYHIHDYESIQDTLKELKGDE